MLFQVLRELWGQKNVGEGVLSSQVGPKPLLSSQAGPTGVHWRGINKCSHLLALLRQPESHLTKLS